MCIILALSIDLWTLSYHSVIATWNYIYTRTHTTHTHAYDIGRSGHSSCYSYTRVFILGIMQAERRRGPSSHLEGMTRSTRPAWHCLISSFVDASSLCSTLMWFSSTRSDKPWEGEKLHSFTVSFPEWFGNETVKERHICTLYGGLFWEYGTWFLSFGCYALLLRVFN